MTRKEQRPKTFIRMVMDGTGQYILEETPYYKALEFYGYPAHVHKDGDAWAVTMAGQRIGLFCDTAKRAIESASDAVERNKANLAEAYARGVERMENLKQ